ncbi:MAG: hypothetical protein CMP20_09405 [Rickettsiales bacterium]|nr:hypothetical protein [Rickettsiales bacterium]
MPGGGFDSVSDSDSEFEFAIVSIEAKRDRDDLEGSDDEAGESERPSQRQRGLNRQEVQDLMNQLDQVQDELDAAKRIRTTDLRRLGVEPGEIDGIEFDIENIDYVLGLFSGIQADQNRLFEDVSYDVAMILERGQKMFRTLIPAEIALYGTVRSGKTAVESREYEEMVRRVLAYYINGSVPSFPLFDYNEIYDPNPTQTNERVLWKIRKNAFDTFESIDNTTPEARPFASFDRAYVDEYILGLKKFVDSNQRNLYNEIRTYWMVEHDIEGLELQSGYERKRRRLKADAPWFILVNKFDLMLQGGPVLILSEMKALEDDLRAGPDQGDVASTAFKNVYKQVEEELGPVEFELQRAVSALPQVGIDKERLRAAYRSPDADQSVFGGLVRLEVLTPSATYVEFVQAHNDASAIRDWIEPVQSSSLSDRTGSFLLKMQEVYKRFDAIPLGRPFLREKYNKRITILDQTYTRAKFPYFETYVKKFKADKKPRKPKKGNNALWNQELEDLLYEIRLESYTRNQQYGDVLKDLDDVAGDLGVVFFTAKNQAFPRTAGEYTKELLKVVLFGNDKDVFTMFDFTSPRATEFSKPKSLDDLGPTVKFGQSWRNTFDAVVQRFVDVNSAGPSSVQSKVARLQELAHNKTLRKDAAKIAKCCGCQAGQSARPSYMTNQSFTEGPVHDNDEYAFIRQQVMEHLDAQFDDNIAQMVQLTKELKKLEIADEHVDALARIAVSQFTTLLSKRLK